jgi:opacity protein-like surface antigen
MKRLLLSALAALALAGCATAPTVYQPAPGPNAVGFSEYRIEPGRWRVSFLGGSGAPAGYVSDLALRRAADLAIQEGYDWFRVSDRFMEALPDRGPRFSVGVGVGGGSGGYGYGRGYRRSGTSVGVGVGTTFPVGGQGGVVKATLEVMMGKGPKPPGADIYDAREIQRAAGVRL